MTWPHSKASAFFRDPEGIYKHDAFGHDRDADRGVREPCFRITPHSGLDFTGRGPIFSVAGGIVAASEWSDGAGWALIEDVTVPGYGRVWLIYFHGEHRMLPAGTATRPGQQLGTIGATGSGTSPGSYHLHLSAATSLAAALRLIRVGNLRRLKGETPSAWARRMGLVDPLPIIRAANAAAARESAATTTTWEDYDMRLAWDTTGTGYLVTDAGWHGLPSMQVYTLFRRLILADQAKDRPDTFLKAEVDIMASYQRAIAAASAAGTTIDAAKFRDALRDVLGEGVDVDATIPEDVLAAAIETATVRVSAALARRVAGED